jgi:hypothetical protein
MAPKEVQGHPHPAGASGNQSAADIQSSRFCRKVRAKEVFEPEELTQSPDDDKKFNCDSYLRPTFFCHAENCIWPPSTLNVTMSFGDRTVNWRKIAIALKTPAAGILSAMAL